MPLSRKKNNQSNFTIIYFSLKILRKSFSNFMIIYTFCPFSVIGLNFISVWYYCLSNRSHFKINYIMIYFLFSLLTIFPTFMIIWHIFPYNPCHSSLQSSKCFWCFFFRSTIIPYSILLRWIIWKYFLFYVKHLYTLDQTSFTMNVYVLVCRSTCAT